MKKYITVELCVSTTRTDDEAEDMIRNHFRTLFLETEVRKVDIVAITEDELQAHDKT